MRIAISQLDGNVSEAYETSGGISLHLLDIENGTLVVQSLLNQFAMFGVPENDKFVCIDDNDKVTFTGTMPGWRADTVGKTGNGLLSR